MDTNAQPPKTLQEAILYFSDPDRCIELVRGLRWPNGITCPRCGHDKQSYLTTRRVWKCKGCKKQFSVKVGTIMEDSPLGLDKWLTAIWLITNAKNGISSCEIARAIGVTQKTAWFLLHRIRHAMKVGSIEKLSGEVEADETYVGGKAKNMHEHKREGMKRGRGSQNKTIVLGLLERQTRAIAKTVPNVKKKTLQREIRKHVEEGAELFTDALASYSGLDDDYVHEVMDHAVAYAIGRVHTNGLENFWSLLSRCIHGTYVHAEPQHLDRYLDEQAFRFNNRQDNDGERFLRVMGQVADKRLTYEELTC